MSNPPPLSAQFLAELEAVYGALRPSLSPAFLTDLEQVHSELVGTEDADLNFLAGRLEEWRDKTRQFLRDHLSLLPP